MTTSQSVTFGALLKRHRRATGLTQEELAGQAELSVEAISALERGVSRAPHKDTVELLANALGLTSQERAVFAASARMRGEAESLPLSHVYSAPAEEGPLVGRDRQLAAIDRHLAGSGPPVLLIAGEPGIGKSRLLREAAKRGRGGGWRVLCGSSSWLGSQDPYACMLQEPYACMLDALHSYIRVQTPTQLRADLRECGWMVSLLPELAESGVLSPPAASLPPEQEKRLMRGAVVRFLATIAGPAGTLLLLDDLQWAGADGLELLLALMQSPAGAPLRVIGTYRDTEVAPQSPLAGALGELAHARLAHQMRLGPLQPEEAATLFAHLVADSPDGDAAVSERVLARAGGVPFFLVSCAEGLRSGSLSSSGPDSVPWDIAETVRQRIASLPESAHELLAVAAVVDRPVSRSIVLAAAARPAWDEGELARGLDEASRARLLMEPEPETYQFAHNLVRDVVWNDVGTAYRATLHRRVAEVLERQPGDAPVEMLAFHYSRCGEREKAVIYLERAGDRARAAYANAAAEGHYRELVARLDELRRPADGARAREKLGTILQRSAHFDEALGVLESAYQMYRALGDRDGLRRTVAQIGRVHARRGTPDEGIVRIQSLLRTADAEPASASLAGLFVALADLYYASGRYRDQLAAAERGAALARAAGDDRLVAQAEQWRSTALLSLGQPEQGLSALEDVLPRAEELGDLSSHMHALDHIALAYMQRGELAKSRAYIERGLAVAAITGDMVQTAFMTYYQGVLDMLAGEWKQAREQFERSVSMVRQLPSSWTSAYPLLGLGSLCLYEGRWQEASHFLQEALTIGERSGDLQALRQAVAALVERDLLEGRVEVARGRLDRLRGRGATSEEDETAQILALLAWVRLEQGATEQAAAAVSASLARAKAEQNRLAEIEALRVRAMIASQQQAWPDAERSLDDALGMCRGLACPYHEARVLYVFGVLESLRDQPDAARHQWEAAASILGRLGERLYAARIRQASATVNVP